MKGAVSSCLLKPLGGGVHSLVSSGESACSQRFDVLGMADLGMCVDHFLSSFEEFLSELSKLKNFPFNEWVAQPSHRAVNQLLKQLSILKKALPKW